MLWLLTTTYLPTTGGVKELDQAELVDSVDIVSEADSVDRVDH